MRELRWRRMWRVLLLLALLIGLKVLITSKSLEENKEQIMNTISYFNGLSNNSKFFERSDEASEMACEIDLDAMPIPLTKIMGLVSFIYSPTASFHNTVYFKNSFKCFLKVVFSAWLRPTKNNEFSCCYLAGNGSVRKTTAITRKYMSRYKSKNLYKAVQFECNIPYFINEPIYVGLAYGNTECETDKNSYLPVKLVTTEGRETIGVCMKHTYGAVDPKRLIEWFEAQMYLGVDKVFSYNYVDLSKAVKKVFQYYHRKGFVEVIPFDVPSKDEFPRHLNNRTPDSYVDKHIPCFDCQERMAGFEYAIFLDKDEIILPEGVQSLEGSLKSLLIDQFTKARSDSSGFLFIVRIHMTSWGVTNRDQKLFIGRYVNSTKPVWDRWKYVYKPERVDPGSCTAHGFAPRKGFQIAVAMETEKATLHHYRRCRKEWMIPTSTGRRLNETLSKQEHTWKFAEADGNNGTLCFDFVREESDRMKQLAEEIADRVSAVTKLLEITDNGIETYWV